MPKRTVPAAGGAMPSSGPNSPAVARANSRLLKEMAKKDLSREQTAAHGDGAEVNDKTGRAFMGS